MANIYIVENLKDVFTYELCSHPPSVFDTDGVLCEAYKSVSLMHYGSIKRELQLFLLDAHTCMFLMVVL